MMANQLLVSCYFAIEYFIVRRNKNNTIGFVFFKNLISCVQVLFSELDFECYSRSRGSVETHLSKK